MRGSRRETRDAGVAVLRRLGNRSRLNRHLGVLRLVLPRSREGVVSSERVDALRDEREARGRSDPVRVLSELEGVPSGKASDETWKREALARGGLSLRVELLLESDELSELVDGLLRHPVRSELLSHVRLPLWKVLVRVTDRREGEGVRGLLLLGLGVLRVDLRFRVLLSGGESERRRLRGVRGFVRVRDGSRSLRRNDDSFRLSVVSVVLFRVNLLVLLQILGSLERFRADLRRWISASQYSVD